MCHAFRFRSLIKEARVQSQESHGLSGNGTGFSTSTSVFPAASVIPQMTRINSLIRYQRYINSATKGVVK
jgi:hypothetical protein